MNKASQNKSVLIISFSVLFVFFQNCLPSNVGVGVRDNSDFFSSTSDSIADGREEIFPIDPESPPNSTTPHVPTTGSEQTICNGVSCSLSPLTQHPAVTTVLLALGDKANDQLVINGGSSQLIAETIVRKSTPVNNPKILVVQDYVIGGEDPEDTAFVSEVLLSRYDAVFMIEPSTGLELSQINGYDLIWFNNPGHRMSSRVTYNTLLSFKGGIVLQGDDLSQGNGFRLDELTHLKFVDNGASIKCGDQTFYTNDNAGAQFQISLDSKYFPNTALGEMQFVYGNDIDLTSVINNDLEILALAKGSHISCQEQRPAIVRYEKRQ